MYDYGYDYGYGYTGADTAFSILGGFAAMAGTFLIIGLVVSIIMIVSQWKIYKKAGKKGWEAIVPIYNIIVLLQIVELPIWYIVLFFVPFANIYAMFKIYIELAHKFGKSTGFGVLTVFFSVICLPILAFGKNNVYNGNNSTINNNINNQTTQYNPNMNTVQNNEMMNNSSNQQPFVFDQNINTEIKPIQPVQNMENNNINNFNSSFNSLTQPEINQTPMFNSPTPTTNQQPEINVMSNVEPLLQPISNQPINDMSNQVNPLPGTIPQQENTLTSENPTPVFNQQPVTNETTNVGLTNAQPQLNVIPGMGQTIEPTMPNQNNNNQNM